MFVVCCQAGSGQWGFIQIFPWKHLPTVARNNATRTMRINHSSKVLVQAEKQGAERYKKFHRGERSCRGEFITTGTPANPTQLPAVSGWQTSRQTDEPTNQRHHQQIHLTIIFSFGPGKEQRFTSGNCLQENLQIIGKENQANIRNREPENFWNFFQNKHLK